MVLAAIKNLLVINRKTVKHGLLIALSCLSLTLVVAMVGLTSIMINKYRSFLHGAQLNHQQVVELVKTFSNIPSKQKQINILILGLDSTANRQEQPQLTDSIILAGLNADSGQVKLVSLPRDLWSDSYQTKINALYQYGLKRYPQQPEQFPQEVVSNLTNITIDHTLVIKLEQLGELIDLADGIIVNVEQEFTDDEFPRSDVDINTETDPKKLYETVSFESGWQKMDGKQALKYIRSRHSQNLEAGTDLARSQRQQQVIQALVSRLTNLCLYWQQPQLAGQLFHYYQSNFGQYLPINELMAIVKGISPNASDLQLQTITIPVANNYSLKQDNDEQPLLVHPDNLQPYQNQWVYTITNQAQFEQFFDQHFQTNTE